MDQLAKLHFDAIIAQHLNPTAPATQALVSEFNTALDKQLEDLLPDFFGGEGMSNTGNTASLTLKEDPYSVPTRWTPLSVQLRCKNHMLIEVSSEFAEYLASRLNHPIEHLNYDRCTFMDIRRMRDAFEAGRTVK